MFEKKFVNKNFLFQDMKEVRKLAGTHGDPKELAVALNQAQEQQVFTLFLVTPWEPVLPFIAGLLFWIRLLMLLLNFPSKISKKMLLLNFPSKISKKQEFLELFCTVDYCSFCLLKYNMRYSMIFSLIRYGTSMNHMNNFSRMSNRNRLP